jgi:hypothetical protein
MLPKIDVQAIWQSIVCILLAVAGGFARLLHTKKKMRIGRILSELFISAFAGMMVLMLARVCGLTGEWLGLVSGMAGWIGPRVLNMIEKPTFRPLGVEFDKKESGGESNG